MRLTLALRLAILAALAMVGGCYASTPGVVHTNADNPIVSIGAGSVEAPGGPSHGEYLVDRAARVCWFAVREAVAPMDCCALARIVEARAFLTWVDAASCGAAATTLGTPPPPARP